MSTGDVDNETRDDSLSDRTQKKQQFKSLRANVLYWSEYTFCRPYVWNSKRFILLSANCRYCILHSIECNCNRSIQCEIVTVYSLLNIITGAFSHSSVIYLFYCYHLAEYRARQSQSLTELHSGDSTDSKKSCIQRAICHTKWINMDRRMYSATLFFGNIYAKFVIVVKLDYKYVWNEHKTWCRLNVNECNKSCMKWVDVVRDESSKQNACRPTDWNQYLICTPFYTRYSSACRCLCRRHAGKCDWISIQLFYLNIVWAYW